MSFTPLGRRLFSTSPPALAVTRRAVKNKWDIAKIGPDVGNDSTSMGHRLIRERREMLHYLRLIEYDVPRLAKFKKPFQPPSKNSPISIRTFTYGGEPHAAEHKAILVAPVSQIGLKSPQAIHKFKLLAGVRWSEAPPRDAGFALGEVETHSFAEHGYIKISSEHFPEVRMNAKWCSDMLDQLIKQANALDFAEDKAEARGAFFRPDEARDDSGLPPRMAAFSRVGKLPLGYYVAQRI